MSEKSLRIATWNISGGLQNEARARAVAGVIEEIDPDVMVLQEAFMDDTAEVRNFFGDIIEGYGYDKATIPYTSSRGLSGQRMMTLARLGLKGAHTSISVGGVNAHYLRIEGHQNPLELYGVHLDSVDSDTRDQQAARLAHIASTSIPAMVLGDFNAMHGEAVKAKTLQRLLPLVDQFEPKYEDPPAVEKKLNHRINSKILRAKGMSRRLVEMASGNALRSLEDAGLCDADQRSRPTHVTRTQLDHIFVNGRVEVIGFERWPRTGLSNHNPISADVITS